MHADEGERIAALHDDVAGVRAEGAGERVAGGVFGHGISLEVQDASSLARRGGDGDGARGQERDAYSPVTSLSPMTPARMSTMQRTRSGAAESPSTAMPTMAVPAAPMPVQTA